MLNITDEERFAVALHSAARSWRLALGRRLTDFGVSQANWMTIAMIAKAKRPLSQTELAQQLGVENPTMVTMIDRLTKMNFVERVPSETDRRVKQVVLTKDGNELYLKFRVKADAFRKELLVNVDAKKIRMMTEVLEALQETAESIK